jgi:hypothetical protein
MNFLSKSEIEKKITLTKGQKNQKNEDQIRKYIYIYIINLDWKMKFKTHRNCTKGSREKL